MKKQMLEQGMEIDPKRKNSKKVINEGCSGCVDTRVEKG
jgi:hypothetical protein